MKWRDTRFEKPTAADADEGMQVLQILEDRSVLNDDYDSLHGVIAWMPLSELPKFERVPDPPEGWRFVQKGEPFDNRARCWNEANEQWFLTQCRDDYSSISTYIVPIDPPKPKYRPFANAAEFEPYRDRWIKNDETLRRVEHYSNAGVNGMTWESLLRNRTFENGLPCGIEVSE